MRRKKEIAVLKIGRNNKLGVRTKFKVTIEGNEPLELQKQIQQFADEFGVVAINNYTGVVMLDAFSRLTFLALKTAPHQMAFRYS